MKLERKILGAVPPPSDLHGLEDLPKLLIGRSTMGAFLSSPVVE